ncbi:MAG: hypothetical protein EHM47_01740 [Ignavibacteriales bacterium]|nr:MAG: hypothetical protein EHM47_01740 [Ignavibacteriales bacterium]
MLDFLKNKIAEKLIDRQLKTQHFEPHTFTGFFNRAYTFFVAMPEDDRDFSYSLSVLNFLAINNKSAMVMTKDFKVSLLPQKFRGRAVEYSLKDINKWNLPAKRLADKLSGMQFNVSIDLNRNENLFYSYSSNLVQAPMKIGFVKPDSDKFYNLQIINHEENPEISYENFLNCLKMFSGLTP